MEQDQLIGKVDRDLTYNPDGELLRKLYPPVEITPELIKGFVKNRRKPVDHGVYVSFKNLNKGKEDLKPHPAIEIGIAGTF